MRFMILVKANNATETGAAPRQEIFSAMADYHEELAKAGALVDANGLHPTSKGWRVQYAGGKRAIVDGPFAETKELIAGYTIIRVASREEAMMWAERFPKPHAEDCYVEVRQMFELEEFDGLVDVGSFREISASLKKK